MSFQSSIIKLIIYVENYVQIIYIDHHRNCVNDSLVSSYLDSMESGPINYTRIFRAQKHGLDLFITSPKPN